MNSKEIDILNVILIIVSLALAFNLPFELFLFSYAFLGPLHYLTEINWLKEKNYFLKETKWVWAFVFFAFLVTLPMIMKQEFLSGYSKSFWYTSINDFLNKFMEEVILIGILFAIGLIYFKKRLHLILFLVPTVVGACLAFNYFPDFALSFAIFIPTIVHVYLFTLLFMIYGTLGSKSKPGIIAIVLLLLVPFIIMTSKINPMEYFPLKESTVNSYNDSNFGILNFSISKLLPQQPEAFNFMSSIGVKIQIFIAFAYTYHYLNWFSKTSIIGWGKNISKTKAITILMIWIASVGLYIYNFKIGFVTLLLLSLIHVFLEFPLNMTSIRGIIAKIKRGN